MPKKKVISFSTDDEARIAYGDRVVISHKHDKLHQSVFQVETEKVSLIEYLQQPEQANILKNKAILATIQYYVQEISYQRFGGEETIAESKSHIIFSVCNNA